MKVRIRISDNSMLDGVEDDDEKWEKDSSTKDEDASTPPPIHHVEQQEFITQERSREGKYSPIASLSP